MSHVLLMVPVQRSGHRTARLQWIPEKDQIGHLRILITRLDPPPDTRLLDDMPVQADMMLVPIDRIPVLPDTTPTRPRSVLEIIPAESRDNSTHSDRSRDHSAHGRHEEQPSTYRDRTGRVQTEEYHTSKAVQSKVVKPPTDDARNVVVSAPPASTARDAAVAPPHAPAASAAPSKLQNLPDVAKDRRWPAHTTNTLMDFSSRTRTLNIGYKRYLVANNTGWVTDDLLPVDAPPKRFTPVRKFPSFHTHLEKRVDCIFLNHRIRNSQDDKIFKGHIKFYSVFNDRVQECKEYKVMYNKGDTKIDSPTRILRSKIGNALQLLCEIMHCMYLVRYDYPPIPDPELVHIDSLGPVDKELMLNYQQTDCLLEDLMDPKGIINPDFPYHYRPSESYQRHHALGDRIEPNVNHASSDYQAKCGPRKSGSRTSQY